MDGDVEWELATLRVRVAQLEAELRRRGAGESGAPASSQSSRAVRRTSEVVCALAAPDIARYGRQLLVPAFGVDGQVALQGSSVVIVGAGGLGCPAAMYLAAAGVGRVGIVDDDVVTLGNLHRQVAHTEARCGTPKAESLAAAVSAVNSRVVVEAHVVRLAPANALDLVRAYDVVLDCSDNPGTRYLLSDACALAGRPLVSGAALGAYGQVTVLCWRGAPCYRCLHPQPPGAVAACADAGVLGPVTGVIGALQALEALKVASRLRRARRPDDAGGGGADEAVEAADAGVSVGCEGDCGGFGEALIGRMLVFDGADALFRVVRLRGRRPDCAACGNGAAIASMADSAAWLAAHGVPLAEGGLSGAHAAATATTAADDRGALSAGASPSTAALDAACLPCNRCQCASCAHGDAESAAGSAPVPTASVEALAEARSTSRATVVVVDCRDTVQFRVCALRGSVNAPLRELQARPAAALATVRAAMAAAAGAIVAGCAGGSLPARSQPPQPAVFVVCRRGVDSVDAVRIMRAVGISAEHVEGGLEAYSKRIDPTFPVY